MTTDQPQGTQGVPGAAGPGEVPPSPSALTDSAAGRLLGALVAPGKTFDSIARRPTWVLAMVFSILVGVAVSYVVMQHLDIGAAARQKIEKSGRSLTPEQVDQQVAMAEKIGKIAGPVAPLVVGPLIYLLVAFIFWLLLRLVGGEVRYPVSLAVALHGMLPQTLQGLLSLPVVASHGIYTQEGMQRGVLASNLAFLAPEGVSPAVVSLLASLDLFVIWSLVLLVIGYRRAGRTSTAATAAVVVGAWLLYVLAKMGWAAAFG